MRAELWSSTPQSAAGACPYWRARLRSGWDCPAASAARRIPASSAGPGSTDSLFSMRLAARIASGLLPAISRATSKAAARGSSQIRVARPVAHGLLRREDAPGIGELAQDVVAHQAGKDRRARHVGHQAPFDLHDRHPRIGREKAHVGAERELEAAAERHALDRGDHRHRKLPPAPHRLLRKIGQAVGARGEVALLAARRPPVAAVFLHRGETPHIEAGAKRPPLPGQYYHPNAPSHGKPFGRGAPAPQTSRHRARSSCPPAPAGHRRCPSEIEIVTRCSMRTLLRSSFVAALQKGCCRF